MKKGLTTEEFIRRAREVHGDKYDYSKVVYVNNRTKVCIICPIHGEFWQIPFSHLQGRGCVKCASAAKRGKVYGVGIYDANYSTCKDSATSKSYDEWTRMLQRCYGDFPKKSSYYGCEVCKEWLSFSKFREWFDMNYIEGYELDKDILIKGNKVYSPQACSYVPRFINTILLNCRSARGEMPMGVQRKYKKYKAKLSCYGKIRYLGSFDTYEEAFNAYKNAREQYIKEVADDYYNKGLITKRVHDALYNWTIEITD